MKLLALVCPTCSSPLPVAEERRVLVCATCAQTWTASSGNDRLVAVSRTLVRPGRAPAPGSEVVLLPVWIVTLHVDRIEDAPTGLPREIRVPALGIARMPLLLQFARNLTRAPLAWSRWEGVEVPIEPAELTVDDAYELAELVVLRHSDHWPADRVVADLEIPLGSARLVDWPCARRGSELVELVGGLGVSRAMVDACALPDRSEQLRSAMEHLPAGRPA